MRGCPLIAIMLMVFCAGAVSAEQKSYTGIRLTETAFKKMKLPSNQSINFIIESLEYWDSRPKVFLNDINYDGINDYILVSNDGLCGTGGCGYTVVDGKTFRIKGEFDGSEPIISDSKVNGHALIMFLRYSGPDKATLEVWAFTKNKYTYQKSIKLEGKSLANQEKLFLAVH